MGKLWEIPESQSALPKFQKAGVEKGLFNAIRQIADTAKSASHSINPDDPESLRHARYHWKIVAVAGVFAAMGLIIALITAIGLSTEVNSGKDTRAVILAPPMFGAGGFVFGMALMCMVAPGPFLTGPIGQPWMKLIGTQSVIVARIVCLLFGLGGAIGLAVLGYLTLLGK